MGCFSFMQQHHDDPLKEWKLLKSKLLERPKDTHNIRADHLLGGPKEGTIKSVQTKRFICWRHVDNVRDLLHRKWGCQLREVQLWQIQLCQVNTMLPDEGLSQANCYSRRR